MSINAAGNLSTLGGSDVMGIRGLNGASDTYGMNGNATGTGFGGFFATVSGTPQQTVMSGLGVTGSNAAGTQTFNLDTGTGNITATGNIKGATLGVGGTNIDATGNIAVASGSNVTVTNGFGDTAVLSSNAANTFAGLSLTSGTGPQTLTVTAPAIVANDGLGNTTKLTGTGVQVSDGVNNASYGAASAQLTDAIGNTTTHTAAGSTTTGIGGNGNIQQI